MSKTGTYYTVKYFLEKLREQYDNNKTIRIDKDIIVKKSIRLKTFKAKGCTCVSCGLKATKVLFRKSDRGKTIVEVIAYKKKKRVLMTVDHTIPKASGGSNRIENLEPMCDICNSRKSNKLLHKVKRIYNVNDVLDSIQRKYKLDNNISRFTKFKVRYIKFLCKRGTNRGTMVEEERLEYILEKVKNRYGFEYSIEKCTPRIIPQK